MGEWMSTGDAASALGVSRQHVVNLCDRGQIECVRVGKHRRIPRSELTRLTSPQLTREQAKSLWIHRAVLGPLMVEPHAVLGAARGNIATWKTRHRRDGMATHYLELWESILDRGLDEVVATLTGTDARSIELRQNSPFAGVLAEDDRRKALKAFREYWDERRAATETRNDAANDVTPRPL